MKIELEVDAGSLHETMAETLKSLSPEKREELCVKVMMAWLKEPHDLEKQAHIRAVEAKYPGDKGNHWEKSRELEKFVSTRDTMIRSIADAAAETYKKRVIELVENDEQLKAKFVILKDMLVEKFPMMVQTAMCHWFAKGFESIGSQLNGIFGMAATAHQLAEEARQKLGLPPSQQQLNRGY